MTLHPLEPRTHLSIASPLTAFTLPVGPSATATDRAGNLYTTGTFAGKTDFDPDPAVEFNLRAFSAIFANPARSQYVAKYAADGALVWALPLATDGAGADPGRTADPGAIAVDRAGNVYVSGHFNGAVDFNPDKNAAFNLTTNTGDAFVCKFDPSGAFVWATRIANGNPAANLATATSLAFGAGTDLFVAGEQTDADFTPYLARLDRATGTLAYIHTLTTDDPELRTVTGLAADPDGNAIMVGGHRNAFGGFAVKYDRDATPLWNLNLPDADDGGLTAVAVNNKGHVFVTGQIDDTTELVNLDPGPGFAPVQPRGGRDAYVVRLNADGRFVWGRTVGGAGDDTIGSITLDNDLNLHLTGSFSAQADFDPRRTQVLLDPGPTQDLYVAKWTPTGNFIDAFQIGAKRRRLQAVPKIVATPPGTILLSGFFNGTIDFDPTDHDLFLNAEPVGAFVATYPA